MIKLINEGRLPISPNNIELIIINLEVNLKEIINTKSCDADLTFIGFKTELVKQLEDPAFEGFGALGNVLFINAHKEKEIISKE